jgi:predicted RNase H-like nuclease
MNPPGLARSYLSAKLPESAMSEFYSIDKALEYGLDWLWVGGRELITIHGLQQVAEKLQRRGQQEAASVVSGELATLQRELAAADAPKDTVACGTAGPYWWQKEEDE